LTDGSQVVAPWLFGGRYEIRSLLGVGGMGSVYEAFDRDLEEVLALKIMKKELSTHADLVDRFKREVRLARRVTHHNVVRVYDGGVAEGTRYFTMELVLGRNLGAILEEGALPLDLLLPLSVDLAAGLAAAHQAGVIHRDVKPDNIVVTPEGRGVWTDFGIARTNASAAGPRTLQGIGTPAYMAPELFLGSLSAADDRCDIFSFGCVLFEAATGRDPWEGPNPFQMAERRVAADAPDARLFRPELPLAFATAVAACLVRDPAQRIATAREVRMALEAVPTPNVRSMAQRSTPGFRRHSPQLDIEPRPTAQEVAVLPIQPQGDADDRLADGLTQAISRALAASRHVRVSPPATVARLRERVGRAAAARKLGVQVLVEGSFARSGAVVHVAARASALQDDFPLWSARFTCDVGDVFTLGDAIAGAVTRAITAPRSGVPAAPADPGAADLVARARRAYNDFRPEGATLAVELYEAARAITPADPGVLAGLALASLRLGLFRGTGLEPARKAAAAAGAVAADHPEVRVARAAIALQDNDPVSAVRDLVRAVSRAPGLGEAHHLLGRVLLEADILDRAQKSFDWAAAMDPELHLVRRDIARARALLGDWDEVERIAAAEPAINAGAAWLDRARAALWRRDVAGATVLLGRMPVDRPATGAIALAHALLTLVSTGSRPDSPEGAAAFVELSLQGQGSPRREAFAAQIDAEIAAFQGRRADAMASIATATAAGLTDLAWLRRCPLFEDARSTPPMRIAMRTVGAVAARVREAFFDD
jgi:TolB-like protein